MPPQGTDREPLMWQEPGSKHLDVDGLSATPEKRPMVIVWRNVMIFTLLHLGSLYGAYLFFLSPQLMWRTRFFGIILGIVGGLGITAGAHRLWAHKCYKAKLPLQILLLIFNTIACEDAVLDWSRDHRLHHKYSDTDADPYNSRRGFFFSHIGWLLVRKHPQIKAKGHTIDMSDLLNDPVLVFQKKYYLLLMPFWCFFVPTYIPTLWGENAWNAFFVCSVLRLVQGLNSTWLVNSAAHLWGHQRAYDKHISPVETKLVSLTTLGEGFHNYHHTFPWDYKAAELGNYTLNPSTLFIDTMAKIGWAYDLKSVSQDVLEKRVRRTGDGSHSVWGDGNSLEEDKNATVVTNSKHTD